MNKIIGVVFIILIVGGLFWWSKQMPKTSVSVPQASTLPQSQNQIQNQSSPGSGNQISSGAVPNNLKPPVGYAIHTFASNLGTARDLIFSPDGTLLVSDPASNKVYALPDKNSDGVADSNQEVLSGGSHIHGLAFFGGKLFVADVNKVVRYSWDEQNLKATEEKVLFSLPNNNDHNNHTIIFDKNGKMYVSVGSTCNVCVESSPLSSTIITSDSQGSSPQVLATGIRNAPFMTFNPSSGELWTTGMGRDNLGDDIPPDEIDIIRPSTDRSRPADYGWPWCYGNTVHDDNFDPSNSHTCENTIPPIFEIPAHSAPLGLVFDSNGDLLVSYHGSWNRSVPTGYKIVKMKVSGNTITGAEDFITGFSNDSARPVDLIFDSSGNLFISDDKAGKIYIVQKN